VPTKQATESKTKEEKQLSGTESTIAGLAALISKVYAKKDEVYLVFPVTHIRE
jgi:hypothetical protein